MGIEVVMKIGDQIAPVGANILFLLKALLEWIGGCARTQRVQELGC